MAFFPVSSSFHVCFEVLGARRVCVITQTAKFESATIQEMRGEALVNWQGNVSACVTCAKRVEMASSRSFSMTLTQTFVWFPETSLSSL